MARVTSASAAVRGFWLLALGALGCGTVSQEQVVVPLFLAGTALDEPVLATGGVQVTLQRADVAFGPLYLCAGVRAGGNCETARLEWLDSEVVDTTDADWMPSGELQGVTGSVRSWMYDLGISSQLTRGEPFVLEAAQRLGGASLVLEGTANVEGAAWSFVASVGVQQTDANEQGVPAIRKSESDEFAHEVQAAEAGLGVRFDPRPWIRGIDFRSLALEQGCSVLEVAPGCEEGLRIEPGSEAHRRLRNALVAGSRPSFEWDVAP